MAPNMQATTLEAHDKQVSNYDRNNYSALLPFQK